MQQAPHFEKSRSQSPEIAGKQSQQQTAPSDFYKNGQIYDDGWFIFAEGKVTGPMTLEEIRQVAKIKEPSSTPNKKKKFLSGKSQVREKPRPLLSRPGLGRWYPLESLLTESGTAVPQKTPPPKNPSTLAKRSRQIIARASEQKTVLKDRSSDDIRAQPARISQNTFSVSSSGPNVISSFLSSRELTASRLAILAYHRRFSEVSAKMPPWGTLPYYHRLIRTQVRLGDIRSPQTIAWLLIPLTLGFAWRSWAKLLATEIFYHLDDPQRLEALLSQSWLWWIPGPMQWRTYQLAQGIKEMEQQHQISLTRPLYAAILSLFPPLAASYLQAKVNRHWEAHVNYALKTTRLT